MTLAEEILGAQILVVDDEPTNVSLIEQLLAKEGYRHVTSLTDSREVPALINETSPDIVLLDLHMPHMDGIELMGRIRSIPTRTFLPILVLTADPSSNTKLAALKGGATDFLNKPFDLSEVLLRIHNLLELRMLYSRLDEWNAELAEAVRERTQALQETLARLRAAEDVRDIFVQNVSHELRTPLTPILGWANVLLERDLTLTEIREGARTIAEQARRLLRVVESLLRTASIRNEEAAPRLALVNCKELVDRIAEGTDTGGRAVTVRVEPGAEILAADERYVGEILQHLLDNAVKFSPEGSPIKINVKEEVGRSRFAVSDHGPGVPMEDREAVFGYFEQADPSTTRSFGGLGAGLYIARQLVAAHGGDISIEETPGGGATFVFTIPASADSPRAQP